MGQPYEKASSARIERILAGFALLNVLGGVVSGVWLGVRGDWMSVVKGLFFGFWLPFVWMIVSLPAVGLGALVLRAKSGGARSGISLGGFMVALWIAALIAVWTLFIFWYFCARNPVEATPPLLVWGYFTTVTPLAYVAAKEGAEKVGTSWGLVLAVVAYAVLVVMYMVGARGPMMMYCVGALAILEALLAAARVTKTATPPENGGVNESVNSS